MNLKEQLKFRQIESEAGRDKTQVDIMRDATEQLIKQGIEKSAPGVNDKIPLFELPNVHGQSVAIKICLSRGQLF